MTMPTTGFNIPRGSFPTPQKPVGVGPLVGPLVEARFNYKWCSLIVGCLSQLLLNTTWDVSTQAELTAIQEDVFDLMSAFCFNPPDAGVTPNTGADGGDDFMLRQNPDNPCELQTSVDGINWCTWADLSKCVPQVAQQAGGSPQPTPGGGCQTYHVILPANGKYLLPTPVNPGDTLLISNLTGASNDGTLAPWYCGDGNLFFAGGCFGSSTTQVSDPINTYPHLGLIAHAGGLYFPVLGGTISIGAVGAFQNLEFQVNDSILSDNQGSLEFDVKICNEQSAGWTHTFDFLTSDGGFVSHPGLPPGQGGSWSPGIGWVPADDIISGQHVRLIDIVHPSASRHITSMFMTFDFTLGTWSIGGTAQKVESTNIIYGSNPNTSPLTGTGKTLGSVQDDATNTELGLTLEPCNNGSAWDGSARITKLVVTGVGTDPF